MSLPYLHIPCLFSPLPHKLTRESVSVLLGPVRFVDKGRGGWALGLNMSEIRFLLFPYLAVLLWARYITSLNFSFLLCKMKIIDQPYVTVAKMKNKVLQ